jgi:hypothetical protein
MAASPLASVICLHICSANSNVCFSWTIEMLDICGPRILWAGPSTADWRKLIISVGDVAHGRVGKEWNIPFPIRLYIRLILSKPKSQIASIVEVSSHFKLKHLLHRLGIELTKIYAWPVFFIIQLPTYLTPSCRVLLLKLIIPQEAKKLHRYSEDPLVSSSWPIMQKLTSRLRYQDIIYLA